MKDILVTLLIDADKYGCANFSIIEQQNILTTEKASSYLRIASSDFYFEHDECNLNTNYNKARY